MQRLFKIRINDEYRKAKTYVIIALTVTTTYSIANVLITVYGMDIGSVRGVGEVMIMTLPGIMNTLTDFQFCVLALSLKQRFSWLNKDVVHGVRLLNCSQLKIPFIISNGFLQNKIQYRLGHIRLKHLQLCEICKKFNDAFSFQILVTITQSFVSTVVIVVYGGRNVFLDNTVDVEYVVYSLFQLSLGVLQICFLVMACSRTANEIKISKEYKRAKLYITVSLTATICCSTANVLLLIYGTNIEDLGIGEFMILILPGVTNTLIDYQFCILAISLKQRFTWLNSDITYGANLLKCGQRKRQSPLSFRKDKRYIIVTFTGTICYSFANAFLTAYGIVYSFGELLLLTLPVIMNTFVAYQFCVLVLSLKQRFSWLNQDIAHGVVLFRRSQKLLSSVTSKDFVQDKIRWRLGQIKFRHFQLCTICKKINNIFSIQMLIIITQSFINIVVVTVYAGGRMFVSKDFFGDHVVYAYLQIPLSVLQLYFVAIASSATTQEASKTAALIHKLLYVQNKARWKPELPVDVW
ncbi:hypothetical protein FQR65_LT08866 [Abscondita terminalis]|nr:hypothetical protein FQR65_LT08866 [Abscondita terminalis]